MALPEFPRIILETIVTGERVVIESARAKLKENILVVKIDRPWNSLPDQVKDRLFVEANRLMANKHRRLKPGCTPSFIPPE